jgi:8-oxo-dGTP pyrophosphatase MutT (NUDIX family)
MMADEPAELPIAGIAVRLSEAADASMQEPYPPGIFAGPPRQAAVLVPMFLQAGEWRLLFIRRAQQAGDRHSGEVAFPGGHLKPGETAQAAALREALEEIALPPGEVELLGSLPPYRTLGNHRVTPWVGRIAWPQPLHPDPAEVSRVFSIPLVWLADPAHHRVRERELPQFGVKLPVVYFDEYQGELLWGVSARITLTLIRVLGL